ncbi:hypothetical protein GWI33_002781 [Rhynchophorus ferrugineus]|uniref:Spaetzle domain-containing protein n=1 Tax=Rhynchophorus ferrugineus TaxID=354439 RepID=A0A834IJZ7_RHYFE|nr:hypothetical protein GWI33_002781 [Rhynchophorus ferrugineus]
MFLFQLLGLAAVFQLVRNEDHFDQALIYGERTKRSLHKNRHERHHNTSAANEYQNFLGRYPYSHSNKLKFEPGKMLLPRQNRQLLEHDFGLMDMKGLGVDCCPSVLEMIEPDGGKNGKDIYVELWKSKDHKQRFYELSCHQDVLNKPCRFMDKKLHNQSRCIQMYSYTYALVKDTQDNRNKKFPTFPGEGSGNSTYTLDYISIRSGCSCVVMPNTNARTTRKKKKHKRRDD